jgi:hypothetical protein
MPKDGRPRLWPSAKAFAAKIDAYFEGQKTDGKPPTIAGLCYFLGFSDKQALTTYEGYGEDFSLPVKKARLRIEQDRSERLLGKDTFTPGVIFDLKNNHGWKDTSQQEVTGDMRVINEIVLRGVRPD